MVPSSTSKSRATPKAASPPPDASRKFSAAPAKSVWTSRSSSASITCPMNFPRKSSRKRVPRRSRFPRPIFEAAAIFATCPSSRLTAKQRAISTMPFMSPRSPAATSSSRFISRTWPTTFAATRHSIARRASAAPPSIFRTALCPCFRRNYRTASARSIRMWTGWS